MHQYEIANKLIPKVLERISTWLANTWISHKYGSCPLWCSPLLAALKISGGVIDIQDIRLCMDYRVVNDWMEEPDYRVPLLRQMLPKLVGKKYFSEFDLANAYHQILLDKDSKEFTYFRISGDDYAWWERMFFGVKGAVTHFQRVMKRVMSKVSPHVCVVVYVDNIVVASDTLKQHV